jgi:hypothetical protein
MSVATVVTLGYGSFGSVADVTRLGYSPEITVPDEDRSSSRNPLYLAPANKLPSRWKGIRNPS